MGRIVTFSLAETFIDRLADDIVAHFPKESWPRLAIVFGGRRPRLFLQKALAKRSARAHFSPQFFSIDEFMERMAGPADLFARLNDLEACFHIYRLAQKQTPQILQDRREFWRFLPWAQEILGFIEQLDLEDADPCALENVSAQSEIGYDVPQSINTLLGHVHILRRCFHEEMIREKSYSRGFIYRLAAQRAADLASLSFDHVLFCNFFYLHKTEEKVMASLFKKGKATLYFHGSGRDWSVLERLSKVFGVKIEPDEEKPMTTEIQVKAGFDLHSEIGLLRKSLQDNKNLSKSLIVLPDPSAVIPLLSEISSFAGDFNVSMGYPVSRSSLSFLFELLFCCQETRKDSAYYAKDYLRLLGHPLVKNLKIGSDAAWTRILVHKIEEALTGVIRGPLAGSLFVKWVDVLSEEEIFDQSIRLLQGMGVSVSRSDLEAVLKQLHILLFAQWEAVTCFEDFADLLEVFLDTLLSKSPLEKFPFHLKAAEQLYGMARQMKTASFRREKFPQEEVLRVFKDRFAGEMISFSGSPLKGLQILGLFETRSLGFEDVYVLDANESILPKLKVSEPLIPRDVMTQLGLNRLEKEEEIQRYQFFSLISCARRAHIFYQERDDREKSRFLEGLVWDREKKEGRLGAVCVSRAAFRLEVKPAAVSVVKRPAHVAFLKDYCFSASSVNTYMKCPLRFYYQYVLGLEEKDRIAEELEPADLGTFLHAFLEKVFRPLKGKPFKMPVAFKKRFMELLDEEFEAELLKKLGPDAFLAREVVRVRMERFLEAEAKRPVREIESLEQMMEAEIRLGRHSCRFCARIDRIDRMEDGSRLVLDYKSGSQEELPLPPEKIQKCSTRQEIRRNIRSFQMPLYVYFAGQSRPEGLLNAALYFLKDPENGLKPLFPENADSQTRSKSVSYYLEVLGTLLAEILDPLIGFSADNTDFSYCRTCPFSCLCR